MKFRKSVSTLFVLLIVLLGQHAQCDVGPASFRTLSELKEETLNGWRQTYTAYGREITIDVEVSIPDAHACPILYTRQRDISVDKFGFDYALSGAGKLVISKEQGKLYTNDRPMLMLDGKAEACPTEPDEVFPLLQTLLTEHGLEPIGFAGQVAYSRAYKMRDVGSDGQFIEDVDTTQEYHDLELDKPLSEAGHYLIYANQLLAGFPVFEGGYFNIWLSDERKMPYPRIMARIYDGENYRYDVTGWMDVVETKYEDVPLRPFSNVQKTIEYYIQLGLLRDIYSIRLGVMPYWASAEEPHRFIMVPVWEIRGRFYVYPTDDDDFRWPSTDYYARNVGGEVLRINAQTGEVLEREEGNDDKRSLAPEILTWDQVR